GGGRLRGGRGRVGLDQALRHRRRRGRNGRAVRARASRTAGSRTAVTVRDNPRELRYELVDDDGKVVGEILYRREPGAVALVHTEVDPSQEGHGLASFLVEQAVQDLRDRGL